MTKLFVWENKYSVGVPSLDAQHKRFFEITNDILNIADNKSSPVLKKDLTLLLIELGKYALNHLSYEENCINRYKCPGYESHTLIHDTYRKKIEVYLHSMRNKDTDIKVLAKEAAEFSRDWLSSHILNKDREYIPCLTEKNVK
jgi:hemerythrin